MGLHSTAVGDHAGIAGDARFGALLVTCSSTDLSELNCDQVLSRHRPILRVGGIQAVTSPLLGVFV